MLEFFTPEVRSAIRESQDYDDLLLVAMDILEEMNDSFAPKPIAMVCGPISNGGTGSRKENLVIFSRAIDRVTSGGLIVFNQMPFENDMERIYNSAPLLQGFRLLEEFYLPIFKSGFVSLLCFLPGWEKSIGAKWEHERAKILKIPRLYLAESYLRNE